MRVVTVILMSLTVPPGAEYTGQKSLPIAQLQICGTGMSAEVAGNAQQWRTGLSYRRELLPDHGMLFVFNDVLPLAFNARKTFIPLSVAFIDNDGTIGEIYSLDRRDVSKRTVLPVKHYQLALEVSAGWFDSNSIGEGCMITGHAEWLMNAVVNQIR